MTQEVEKMKLNKAALEQRIKEETDRFQKYK